MSTVVCALVAEFTLENRHLPWKKLSVDERSGLATELKLRALGLGPDKWCHSTLATSTQLEAAELAPKSEQGGCGWSRAYAFSASGEAKIAGGLLPAMRCPQLLGAHIWLTSLQYKSKEILGMEIRRIHHAGTYSCRRMYNRSSGPMSEHAFANAWDVTGFELDDGTVISVLKHWQSGGEKQRFLESARDEACSVFNVVLSPDYNDAHNDHLHLDMGGGVICD